MKRDTMRHMRYTLPTLQTTFIIFSAATLGTMRSIAASYSTKGIWYCHHEKYPSVTSAQLMSPAAADCAAP